MEPINQITNYQIMPKFTCSAKFPRPICHLLRIEMTNAVMRWLSDDVTFLPLLVDVVANLL
jgi:hypothetical protein